MKLILIRHGATPSNETKQYMGRTDESLSASGIQQLHENKRNNKYPKVSFLASSPMKRCRETAELLYGTQSCRIIDEWREIDFGAFEGENYKTLTGNPQYQAWIASNGTLPFPQGESLEQFKKRCMKGFDQFIQEWQNQAVKDAGIIVHGGTIMAILSTLCQQDYFAYHCGNGAGYVVHGQLCNQKWELHTVEKL